MSIPCQRPILLLLAAVLMGIAGTSCNTARGFGKDLEHVGNRIEKSGFEMTARPAATGSSACKHQTGSDFMFRGPEMPLDARFCRDTAMHPLQFMD